ncbi:MAG: hypothetical protein ACR2QA_01025 [Solirubrobacteraceae bacterium]
MVAVRKVEGRLDPQNTVLVWPYFDLVPDGGAEINLQGGGL